MRGSFEGSGRLQAFGTSSVRSLRVALALTLLATLGLATAEGDADEGDADRFRAKGYPALGESPAPGSPSSVESTRRAALTDRSEAGQGRRLTAVTG